MSGTNSPTPAELAERTFAFAREAEARRDWAQALSRWNTARRRCPDLPAGHLRPAVALRRPGRLEEAERLLTAAVQRFPEDGLLRFEHAVVAAERADWPAAVERWAVLRSRLPEQLAGYVGGAVALREQGRFDEAEALFADVVA